MKTFTAREFKSNPAKIYDAATKDGSVRINHSNYKDLIFELIARDRSFVSMVDKEEE